MPSHLKIFERNNIKETKQNSRGPLLPREMNLSFKNAYIQCEMANAFAETEMDVTITLHYRPQLDIRLYLTKISDDLFQLFDNIKTNAS